MLVPELPAELDEFICTLLDKNPNRRPTNAVALLEELERIRGKLERKGEKLDWPAKVTPDTAETLALSAALGGNGAEAEPEAERRPLLKRPLVVIPLFLAVIAALILPFVWPSPAPEELFASAKPLLESENPDNWDLAFEKYLEPLSQKFPDRYVDEIAQARARVKDRRELKRALAEGAKLDLKSYAEAAYMRGLRLAQAGDADAAKRTWHALEQAYASVPSESRWVELSRLGLKALDKPENHNLHGMPDRAAFDIAVNRARSLLSSNQAAEAAAIFRALQELYRDDPAASDAIRQAMEAK
jgi:hypothetical protein